MSESLSDYALSRLVASIGPLCGETLHANGHAEAPPCIEHTAPLGACCRITLCGRLCEQCVAARPHSSTNVLFGVGTYVGAYVGAYVGSSDGPVLGAGVGSTSTDVGTSEGSAVGSAVGSNVGKGVGLTR